MQEPNSEEKIGQDLIQAAKQLNYPLVKDLLSKGANANFVLYTDSNCWYQGNSHTPLYSAVHTNFQNKIQSYLDVIQILLKHKANPNFKAVRGGWNHCEAYPTFNGVIRALPQIKDVNDKIRLIKMFVDAGVSINQTQRHGRDKGWRSHSTFTCFVFNMLSQVGLHSKINLLQNKLRYQRDKQLRKQFNQIYNKDLQNLDKQEEQVQEQQNECKTYKDKKLEQQIDTSLIEALIQFGADVNSMRRYNYWQNYSADYAEDQEVIENEYQTVIHRAIMHNCKKLVKILLEKGANPNTQCSFTVKTLFYPDEWCQDIKIAKRKKNQKQLFEAEKRRQTLRKSLEEQEQKQKNPQLYKHKKLQERKQKQKIRAQYQGQEGEEDDIRDSEDENESNIKQIESQLREIEFQIFKHRKYVVDNDLPYNKYKEIKVSCIELADKLECCQQIKDMLKEYQLKCKQKQNSD